MEGKKKQDARVFVGEKEPKQPTRRAEQQGISLQTAASSTKTTEEMNNEQLREQRDEGVTGFQDSRRESTKSVSTGSKASRSRRKLVAAGVIKPWVT